MLKRTRFYNFLRIMKGVVSWSHTQYAPPSPYFVKQACLLRNGKPNTQWIETGTYMGDTTAVLASCNPMVYSIEPEPKLFRNAVKRFQSAKNVHILNSTSENSLPDLLSRLGGDINFWLDGHFSSGVTFQGSSDTPIQQELDAISKYLDRFSDVTIMIDDIRCFNPNIEEFSTYPTIDYLVDWARMHNFTWHIEHDIFIAKNYSS